MKKIVLFCLVNLVGLDEYKFKLRGSSDVVFCSMVTQDGGVGSADQQLDLYIKVLSISGSFLNSIPRKYVKRKAPLNPIKCLTSIKWQNSCVFRILICIMFRTPQILWNLFLFLMKPFCSLSIMSIGCNSNLLAKALQSILMS